MELVETTFKYCLFLQVFAFTKGKREEKEKSCC